jgi:hypothetical protein
MRVRPFGVLSLGALVLTLSAGTAAAQAPAERKDMAADVRALAERIDKMIEARWKEAGVKPAPPANDHQFFRRLNIDLNGRIPSLTDLRDFIEDDTPDKRPWWIDRVLDYEDLQRTRLFPAHFAAVMRSWMLTGNNANFQIQALQPGFEAWLNEHLTKNTPYDQLVRDLIVSQPLNRGGATPQAFYIDNENKPENLASATSRVFLGVKLECAQCHPHPFAKWTKNQFWEYAAFFSGFNRFAPQQGRRPVQPAVLLNANEIKIPGTDKVVKARFLDGKQPQFKNGEDPRQVLVDWMVAQDNPFFARAAVDHLWSYFFGVSLLEPIMEPADDGLPTHPQLLDMLAKEFRASGHDLRFMIRAIVNTKAYQRGSSSPHASKDDVYYFARMPVRGMSPEQLYDSVAEATGLDEKRTGPQQFQPQPFNQQTPRRDFIARFSSQDKRTESQTSILQALFLMNGKFLADRTRPDRNDSLKTLITQPTSVARKVDTLYFMALSRAPRQEELDRLVRYVESGGPTGDQGRALSDIYWALLNCGEFCLNH